MSQTRRLPCTSSLIRNVTGVTKDGQYDFSIGRKVSYWQIVYNLSIGASWTYFKTKNSAYQYKRSGKEAATAKSARYRQRKHNIRRSITCFSNSQYFLPESSFSTKGIESINHLNCDEKEKIKPDLPELTTDFMSSDKSDADSTSEPISRHACR